MNIAGTRQIYNPGDGTNFPERMVSQLQGITPGLDDKICTIANCTQYSCLEELCAIDATTASYSETEFHSEAP